MKALTLSAVAASLTLIAGATIYVEGLSASAENAAKPSQEMIASDYLDANWKLTASTDASAPSRRQQMELIANNYLDANWRITGDAKSTSPKSEDAISTDYFDANWSVVDPR